MPPKGAGGKPAEPEKGKGKGEKVKMPPRAKWINDDAPQFWAQRRAADYLVTGWAEVAQLFGIEKPE